MPTQCWVAAARREFEGTRGLSGELPWRQKLRHGGFTLLEIVLVLAIIAAIGAIAMPAIRGILDRQRLEASAERIRLALDRARLDAMKTGQAQMFECQPGSGKYSVHPLTQQADVKNAAQGATVVTQTGLVAETTQSGMLTAAEPTALSGEAKDLEERVTFVSCMVASDSRAFNVAQQSQASSGQVTTANIGQVILFYPDGSTTNAEVRIQNVNGDIRAVRLRGLTGHCKVLTVSNGTPTNGASGQ